MAHRLRCLVQSTRRPRSFDQEGCSRDGRIFPPLQSRRGRGMTLLTMANPNPVPLDFPKLTKGSNNVVEMAEGTPDP